MGRTVVRGTEDGVATVEYALLIVLIAVVCVLGIGFLGQSVDGRFTTFTSAFTVPD